MSACAAAFSKSRWIHARICLAVVLAAMSIGCAIAGPPPAPGPHACADFLSRTDFDVSVMDAKVVNAGTEAERLPDDPSAR